MDIKRALHIKAGADFQTTLWATPEWVTAAGNALARTGRSITLGTRALSLTVNDRASLQGLLERFDNDPRALAAVLGVPESGLAAYKAELLEAIDDVLSPTTVLVTGDTIDLRQQSELAAVLGLTSDAAYGAGRTSTGDALGDTAPLSFAEMFVQRNAPVDPLEGVSIIEDSTFTASSFPWGRNEIELEAVRTMNLPVDQLMQIVRNLRRDQPEYRWSGTNADGERVTNQRLYAADINAARAQLEADGVSIDRIAVRAPRGLRRLRKAKAAAMIASQSDVNLMDWSSRAHRLREANPYVRLTIESGRLVWDEDEWEVELGTDYNIDTYYKGRGADPDNDVLRANDIVVRTRIRLDDPTFDAIRRILTQAKIGSEVDATGLKRSFKIDSRNDSPTMESIEAMLENVLKGQDWNGQATEALAKVHEVLARGDQLLTIGMHNNVLTLEAGGIVKSERSRFHYNEASTRETTNLFNRGEAWINEVVELVEKSSLPAADKERLAQLGRAITDPERALVLERSRAGLEALGAAADKATIDAAWPSTSVSVSPEVADNRKVVSETLKSLYDEFSTAFDSIRDEIAGDRGSPLDRDDAFDFFKERNEDLVRIQTAQPLLSYFDEQLAGADRETFVGELADYLADEGDSSLRDAVGPARDELLGALRRDMLNEHLDILHRQIESAGTAALSNWFTSARQAYADIWASSGNLLIDTFDIAEFYTPENWETLSEDQKAGAELTPLDSMYHAMVVNEVQIELDAVSPYTDAVNERRHDLLLGYFMEWAIAQDPTLETADRARRMEVYDETDPQRVLEIANESARRDGVPFELGREDLDRIDDLENWNRQNLFGSIEAMTPEHVASLVRAHDMANFFLDELIAVQERVADQRGGRVREVAEDILGTDVEWVRSEFSKGETAIDRRPA